MKQKQAFRREFIRVCVCACAHKRLLPTSWASLIQSAVILIGDEKNRRRCNTLNGYFNLGSSEDHLSQYRIRKKFNCTLTRSSPPTFFVHRPYVRRRINEKTFEQKMIVSQVSLHQTDTNIHIYSYKRTARAERGLLFIHSFIQSLIHDRMNIKSVC